MKIVIPGGTGQIGTILARTFHADNHQVAVLSRKPARAPWRVAVWDGETLGAWATEIEDADVVINLAGRSVNCRYNAENRREILESRVKSTRMVGEAIGRASRPPRLWLQMSTATIYAHRYDAPNDETNGILGGDEPGAPDTWRFSIDVARAWEKAVDEAIISPETRRVKLRAAVVMSPDRGGAFALLLGIVRRGLGGRSASGRQFVSWIHGEDFVRAVNWIIDHKEIEGAINLAAPNPLPNADFMRELREAWGIRLGLPATSLMLELGALLMRSETELILKSRRVVPKRLLESGFQFHFAYWESAAKDLCRRWREANEPTRESAA